jgi:lipoyl-dependent peroxiredoxin
MAATNRAEATWSGDLLTGKGTVTAGTTRVFVDQPISWEARIGEDQSLTTPEELLAASHAACFAMACSNNLAKAGTPPTKLSVSVDVTADTTDAGWTVKSAHIIVRGNVPGATEESFRTAAEGAKDGCPISRALAGNVELSIEAIHEGG